MTIIRTLGFAAAAALSLGIGTAMAQNDGPSTPEGNWQATQPGVQYRAPVNANQPQSGSSDVSGMQPKTQFQPTTDYGDIDSPG